MVLADEMGLGKTIQVISLLSEIYQRPVRASLLVVPLTLIENWRREILKFAPHLTFYVHHGESREALLSDIQTSPTATPVMSATPNQILTPIATVTITSTPSPSPTAAPAKESSTTDSPLPPWIPWGTNARPGAVIAVRSLDSDGLEYHCAVTQADDLGQWFLRIDGFCGSDDSLVTFIEHTGRKATARFNRAYGTKIIFGNDSIQTASAYPTFIAWGTDAPPYTHILANNDCGETRANASGVWLIVHKTESLTCRSSLRPFPKYPMFLDMSSMSRNGLTSPIVAYGTYHPNGHDRIFFGHGNSIQQNGK